MIRTLSMILGLVLMACGHAQVNLLNGLSACYSMACSNDSTVYNNAASGNILDGKRHGNVVCDSGYTGAAFTALRFGGTVQDFVRIPANPLIKPTSTLTIAGWFYPTENRMQDIIFTKNTCAYNFNMNNFIWSYGQFWIAKRPGAPGSCSAGAILTTTNTVPYPIKQWYFVVAYIDNSLLEIWVNNVLAGTMSHNVSFDYENAGPVILGGTNQGAANNPYTGKIDDLRFYTRRLNQQEMTTLYSNMPACNTNDMTGIPSFDRNRPGLRYAAHYLQLSPEIRSVKVYDLSGRQVLSVQSPPGNSATVDCSVLPLGLYLAELQDAQGLWFERLVLDNH